MKNFEDTNTLFPIFLKPSALSILVVGGGYVATEKLHFLLKSSPIANVTIIAPEVCKEVIDMAESHQFIRIIFEKYDVEVIGAHDIVVVATNDHDLNKRIWQDAKAKKVLVNVADTPSLCDFYMSSIVTKGDLKIAISTNGKSPTFAKRFRELLEDTLPDNLQETLNNLQEIRNRLTGDFSSKVKELNRITSNLIS